jgi:hypothetical protein
MGLTVRALRHQLDMRKIDLAAGVGALLRAVEMTVSAVDTASIERLLA